MKVRDTNHVADFRDLCPRLSPRGSFGESRRNGISAYVNIFDDRADVFTPVGVLWENAENGCPVFQLNLE